MAITTSNHSPETGATMALLSVVLDRASREPLGRQLYVNIRDMILSGRLAEGAKLPSSRRLSDDLGVSRTVTLFAYDQLGADGFLVAQHGSGHYMQAPKRAASARSSETEAGGRAMPLRDHPFDPDAPPSDLFPVGAWSRLMARAWQREGMAATAFDEWAGLASLRTAIAAYLGGLQGLDCTADQVVITAGNADALRLIARGLDAAGSKIWVEDPGHIGARQTLTREGLEVVPVPVDRDGLNVSSGRRLAADARLALVTPARQFPTGVPLSLSRRHALLDWAAETGAVIIADDYDSELRFAGRPTEGLAGLDRHGVVLSVGSFSKITFPGLRLGYIVGPSPLINRLIEARARDGSLVATAAQPALAEFIGTGALAKHLRSLRMQMTLRRDALANALTVRFGGAITILPQEVGMHLVVALGDSLAAGWSDVEISALAVTRGLRLDPLSGHAAAQGGRRGFLLGYAAWDDADLRAGVETLAEVLAGCGADPASL